MISPVLTPTEAPQWFSEAYEDAEREYWVAVKYEGSSFQRMAPLDESWIYLTREAALKRCEPGCEPASWTLNQVVQHAIAYDRRWIVLRDADGIELKRWSVTA